jgi:flagellum-specific ATP synthase
VEGDDFNDPVADAVRSILDGHIVLSRRMATAGQYPAIDVLDSVSRLSDKVAPAEQVADAKTLLESMAVYRENEDLIQIGAYERGSSEEIDRAIDLRPRWQEYLRQGRGERSAWSESAEGLARLVRS